MTAADLASPLNRNRYAPGYRIDTRDRDDAGKGIPGTGSAYACDRCTRSHEVWIELRELAYHVEPGAVFGKWRHTGRTLIVGESCARKLRLAGTVPSASSAITTRTAGFDRLVGAIVERRAQALADLGNAAGEHG